METLDGLEFQRTDGGYDVVFDDALVALKGQELHFALAKRAQPFRHPGRHGDFIRGLVSPSVQLPEDGRHFLPDRRLGIAVYAPPYGLTRARVDSSSDAGLPSSVRALPDGAAVLGIFLCH